MTDKNKEKSRKETKLDLTTIIMFISTLFLSTFILFVINEGKDANPDYNEVPTDITSVEPGTNIIITPRMDDTGKPENSKEIREHYNYVMKLVNKLNKNQQ
ncbi:hypothetical protein SNEBB_001954 [Seison nebaliae]|nr:hypothetical protein SNEBB_001954 [Seison nebaliae]